MDPAATPDASIGWGRAGLRALGGLLSLVVAFIPELVASFIGAVFGGVIGVIGGIGMTASLLEGGGSWGHAGLIALVIPVLTFFGPILLGVAIGAIGLSTLVLVVHAIVIVARRTDEYVARQLVVVTTAVGAFIPALLLGGSAALAGESFVGGAMIGALVFTPLMGAVGLLGGAGYAGVRSLLAGRSLGQWWRDADGTMGVALLATSLFSWFGIWFPFAILVLFPAVVLALGIAIALGVRLWLAGSQRGVVTVVVVVDVLHASLLAWALGQALGS